MLNSPMDRKEVIDASAGTGKTFSIAALFLRLIWEEEVSVRKILTVTFTKKATAELKQRIHSLLKNALDCVVHGKEREKSEWSLVIEKVIKTGDIENKAKIELLKEAVHCFDEASIFTIHGFCQRVLKEHAFETLNDFDSQLVTDEGLINSLIFRDYWRERMDGFPKWLVQTLLTESNDILKNYERNILSVKEKRYHKIINKVDENDFKKIGKLWDRFGEIWKKEKDRLFSILDEYVLKNGLLSTKEREKYYKNVENYIDEGFFYYTPIKAFSESYIKSKLKKKYSKAPGSFPGHALFSLCDDMKIIVERVLDCFYRDVLEYYWNRREKLKKEERFFTYHDLLYVTRESLKNDDQGLLKRSLRKKYRAALIDEFQDTDPVQYDIFEKIFSAEDHFLFLIGDPKQSIYGFRDADVFIFQDVYQSGKYKRNHLKVNYRSHSELVQAVNCLFNVKKPFQYDYIEYDEVESSGRKDEGFRYSKENNIYPLSIWDFEKSLHKRNPPSMIIKEILRLMNMSKKGELTLEGRPLRLGDFAVLVNTNRQAEEIRRAFEEKQIPVIIPGTRSVFQTSEAEDLRIFLKAVLNYTDRKTLKSALLTLFFDYSLPDMDRLNEDDEGLRDIISEFSQLHGIWTEKGFFHMMARFWDKFQVLSSLVGKKGHENIKRVQTNLNHLMERACFVENSEHLTPRKLIIWLEDKAASKNCPDEDALRVDSGQDAVQIMTVFKSKGLEFNFVFYPYVGRRNRRNSSPSYHDVNRRRVIDFSVIRKNNPEAEDMVRGENDAEELRIFYVALTRAVYMNYLFLGTQSGESKAPLEKFINPLFEKDEKDFPHHICLRHVDNNDFLFEEQASMEEKRKKDEIHEKMDLLFERRFDLHWKINSFSALSANNDVQGFHAIEEETSDNVILNIPGGTETGLIFHDVFESLDYQNDNFEEVVKEILKKYSIRWALDKGPKEIIRQVVERVVSFPLIFENKEIYLKNIPFSQRMNEVEFYFQTDRFSFSSLKKEFPQLSRGLIFDDFKGFLHGFIDLIFQWEGKYYIVDWKTNHLGFDEERYRGDDLEKAMKEHHYHLQALIYTLALNDFLKGKLEDFDYEKHVGGVFYLFVRGMAAFPDSRDAGVYYYRFPFQKLNGMIKEIRNEDS